MPEASTAAPFEVLGEEDAPASSGASGSFQVLGEEDPTPALPPEVEQAIRSVPRPQSVQPQQTESVLADPFLESGETPDDVQPTPSANEQTERSAFLADLAAQNRRTATVKGVAKAAVGGVGDVLTNTGMPGNLANPPLGSREVQHLEQAGTKGQRLEGAAGLVGDIGETVSPLLGVGAIEAPVSSAVGLGTGFAASKGAQLATKAAGGGQGAQDLASELGFWLPAAGGVLRPRLGIGVSPEEVLVGAGIKPPGMEPRAVGIRIPRGPIPDVAPSNGIEAPTIEGNPQPAPPPPGSPQAEAATALAQAAQMDQMSARAARGLSPTPPPPAPPASPPPLKEITPQDVAKLGQIIVSLPPEQRAQGIMEAHEALTKMLVNQGRVVGPDGKLEVVDSPKSAANLAQRIINDEVDRRDQVAESQRKDAAKNASSAADQGKKAASVAALKAQRQNAFDVVGEEEPAVESANATTDSNRREPPVQRAGSSELSKAVQPRQVTGGSEGSGESSAVPASARQEVPMGRGREEASGDGEANNEEILPPAKGGDQANAGEAQPHSGHEVIGEEDAPPTKLKSGDKIVLPDGRPGTIDYSSPTMNLVRLRTDDGEKQTISGAKEIAKLKPAEEDDEPTYKYRSTQANIHADSEAAEALKAARDRIAADDLVGDGKDIGGNHVTVRYGLKDGTDLEPVRKYLSSLEPFEATLGKTDVFPPSESSDGGAVVHAPIESPELHKINDEIQKHGEFAPSNFPEYKPHATVGYVKPETAARYKGMDITEGKKFKVDRIAITDRNGGQEMVRLQGRAQGAPEPGKVGEMALSDLTLAPNKFQFKLGTDVEGASTLLKEARKFNPELAGTISVWKDPTNGRYYVINGHHRFELAKRMGVKQIAVRHIRAKDAAEARAVGARQNIAEGRGTPVDAAKFFRETGATPEKLAEHGISLGEATASKGLALSRLDPSLFTRVVNGELPLGRAVAIGEATDDPAEQKSILELLRKKDRLGRKVSDDVLRELIRFVKGSGKSEESQADLFGSQIITRSHALEKAEVSAYVKHQLMSDKKLFGTVSKQGHAERLAEGGNKIDVERSRDISSGAAQAEEVYDKLSGRGGPISDILDDAAGRLAEGENGAKVKSDTYQRIRAEVSKVLSPGAGPVSEGLEAGAGRREAPEAATSQSEGAITAGSEVKLRDGSTATVESVHSTTLSVKLSNGNTMGVSRESVTPIKPPAAIEPIGANPNFADPHEVQELRNSIREGELRLTDKKLDPDRAKAIRRSLEVTRAKLDALLSQHREEPTLPGMEQVPAERAEASSEQQGKDLTAKLTEPPKSIEAKAGDIEQHSPLFRDTEANPQSNLFAGDSRKPTADDFLDRVNADRSRFVDRYIAENTLPNGEVAISADRARSLFPEYAASKESAAENTIATNKAASTVASAAFDRVVASGSLKDKQVVFVAGGPGSGKSTAQSAIEEGGAELGLLYEGNLSSPSLLEQRVQAVLDAGAHPVTVAYVYAPPTVALERVISRAKKIGRFVPIEYGSRVAANTPSSIAALSEKLGDKVRYEAIDNSGAPEDAKVTRGIDAIRKLAHNQSSDEIRAEQLEHAEALHKAGKLDDDLYARLQGREAPGSPGKGNEGQHRETPASSLTDLFTSESGSLDPSKLAAPVAEVFKQDVAPALAKAGTSIRDVAAHFVSAFYPRIEESSLLGRALDVGAPTEAVDALMKLKGERAREVAEFDGIMRGMEKMFDRLPDELRVDFIDRMQTGERQPTAQLREIAETVKKIQDEQRDQEQIAANLGRPPAQQIKLPTKQNYFNNRWDTPPGGGKAEDEETRISRLFTPRRPLEGTKSYNKQQKYTLRSGIEAGGKPTTTNPIRLLRLRIEDGMKFVSARRAWDELGRLDLRQYVPRGQRIPEGFSPIDDRIARVYFPAELASGKTAAMEGGQWVVEANTARLLNNMLSRDLIRSNTAGAGLMWLKNASTAIELGLSPFHAVFETIEAASSQLSLGMLRTYNLGVRGADAHEFVTGLRQMLEAPVAPATMAREGAALPAYIEARARLEKIGVTEFGHKQIEGTQPHGVMESLEHFRQVRRDKNIQRLLKRYPDLDQLIDDMFTGGMVIGQHADYQVKMLGKTAMEAWTAGNPLGAIARAVPTILQGTMKPLFQWYIPNLKYSLFLRMMSEQAAEHAADLESGALTRAQLARKVVDSVENRFGEMNFDNLFWNRTLKTGLQFAFRSVTWKLGTGREIGGAATGQARELGEWAWQAHKLLGGSGEPPKAGEDGKIPFPEPEMKKPGALPKLDAKMSWVLSLLLTSVALGTIASKVLSKKYPWEWTAEEAKDKAEDSWDWFKSLYRETVHPRTGETDSHGLPVRINLATYLKEIEAALKNPARYVVGSLSGIVSKAHDIAENEDYFGNYVYNPNASMGTKLRQIGKYAAPEPFAISGFERGKDLGKGKTAYLSAFGFPRAPADLDFTPAEKLAHDLGHKERLTPEQVDQWKEKRDALKDGTATRKEMHAYVRQQRLTWLQRDFKGLGYPDALRVYDIATEQEKAELSHLLRQKRRNLRERGHSDEVSAAEATQ